MGAAPFSFKAILREAARIASFLVLATILIGLMIAAQDDFFVAQGSEMGAVIFRHDAGYQGVCLSFALLSLAVAIFSKGLPYKAVARVLLSASGLFLYMMSLQILVLDVSEHEFREQYGPLTIKTIDLMPEKQCGGSLLLWEEGAFFLGLSNQEGRTLAIPRWPAPFRHGVSSFGTWERYLRPKEEAHACTGGS